MATTVQTPATKAAGKIPMTSTRKTALVAGVFYLITFVSIPTLALYGPVKNHRDWILGSGCHTGVLVGGFLEVIVALAGIGTAVALYPVVKRQNEGFALGFVTSRVIEAGHDLHRCRQPPFARDLATGPGPEAATRPRLSPPPRRTSRPTNGRSCSGRTSCRASTRCCSAPCCTGPGWCPVSFPRSDSSQAPCSSPSVVATMFGGIKLGLPPHSPGSRWRPGSSRWASGWS